MRTHTFTAVVIGSWLAAAIVLAAADDTTNDDVQKELKKLEGTWVWVSAEHNGRQVTDDFKDFRLILKGDKLTIKKGDDAATGSLKLDLSKKPKMITLSAVTWRGREVPDSVLGIYALDGDTLKVCYTSQGGERPKAFNTKDGTNLNPITLEVYEREKTK
jgi:uncharacterized protein (TIGR03067 family)